MKPVLMDPFIEKVLQCVQKHKLAPGCYARYLWNNDKGTRKMGVNEYGCADAANILYTVGHFPSDPEERAAFVECLQGMQDPVTGLFYEDTHDPIHTTAHCTAALELFDAKALYPCTGLREYTTREGLYSLLEDDRCWINAWPGSHRGAGILPSLVNTGMVDLQWKDWYFDWLWEHSDPEIGFVCFGPKRSPMLRDYMCGGFHYLFNHESERRPFRYPEKIIDFCLELLADWKTHQLLGVRKACDFINIDVIYSVTRSMRQTDHRFWECKAALETYAEAYVQLLLSIDYDSDDSFNDLHMLFGALCALAELQVCLPGKIRTSRPLKLVLDRRPFI